MSSRLRIKGRIEALQHQHDALCEEVAGLVQAHRGLLLRYTLLSAWCDSLSILQLNLADESAGTDDTGAGCQFQLLLQKEVDLLQQLTASGHLAEYQETLGSLLQPDVQTIAPYTDPMAYFRRIVLQPRAQEAPTMTAEQLAAFVHKHVHAISIKMHLLEGKAPWERPAMLQEIADLWDRYWHVVSSIVLLGNEDVAEHATFINLETLQHDAAAASSHLVSQAAVVVPILGLTEQQQEIITAGMHLYYDLVVTIHRERQDLQTQMAAVEADSTHGSNQESATVSAGSQAGPLDNLSERRLQLQKEEALTSRLQQLLHKEYMLRAAMLAWFVGTLSVEQLSQAAVMCWPYTMRPLFFATEIMQQRDKLMQRRLQLSTSRNEADGLQH